MSGNTIENIRKGVSDYLSGRVSAEVGIPVSVILKSPEYRLRSDLAECIKDPANIKEYHGLIPTEVISVEKAREGFKHYPYEKRYLEPGNPIHTTNPVIKD